jgi:hypothetical protein
MLHVAITGVGDAGAAIDAVRRHYQGNQDPALLGAMTPVPVEYDYAQLYDWKQRLQAVLAMKGPSGFAVHVTTNTVDIFSPDAGVDNAIATAGSALAIPGNAVRVIRAAPPRPLSIDLKDQFYPGVPGGVGIELTGPSSPKLCSLGVNVKLTYNATEWTALTASHCTQTWGGGADNTTVHQGASWSINPPPSGYVMGHEYADPSWSQSGCDSPYTHCRWADVAVLDYDANPVADSGYIAVTVKRDSLTTLWISKDSTSRRVTEYFDDQPWEGVHLDHTGAVTGWHSGTVTESCVNFEAPVPGLSGYELKCQTITSGLADYGDSGGPVFTESGGKRVTFVGIVSLRPDGATDTLYTFSAYPNICSDLGACPRVSWR